FKQHVQNDNLLINCKSGHKGKKKSSIFTHFPLIYIPWEPNTSPTIYQSAFYPLCNANPNTASNLLIINILTSLQSFSSQSNGHIVPETSAPLARTEKYHRGCFTPSPENKGGSRQD
ncbi:MAG: hypothetical protein IJV11_11210, partial [Muribaculaceae bacterium]|nr:hypothetical protein [Muribaculaceae bacterium]